MHLSYSVRSRRNVDFFLTVFCGLKRMLCRCSWMGWHFWPFWSRIRWVSFFSSFAATLYCVLLDETSLMMLRYACLSLMMLLRRSVGVGWGDVREWCVLQILTSKCASRRNGVHFLDISTSKSGPRMVCFVHFDLEMCFAPRRAIFHLSSGQLALHPPL